MMNDHVNGTEEQLVGLLHGAAIEYEGTHIQGLLCRAGDVVLSMRTTLGHIRELAEEHNGGPEYGGVGWGQVMEWCDIHLDGQRKKANSLLDGNPTPPIMGEEPRKETR